MWRWLCAGRGTALYGIAQDDCKYLCMRQHTEQRRALGQPVLKYHGKWPFVRVLGVQVTLAKVRLGLATDALGEARVTLPVGGLGLLVQTWYPIIRWAQALQ